MKRLIGENSLLEIIEAMKLNGLCGDRGEKGNFHPYVSGLVFSKKIIEELEKFAPDDLHLGWGQIMDGDVLSGEVDVFAFKGKPLYHWESIGYSIVPKEAVEFVIECKRIFPDYKIMEDAFKQLSPWLSSF